MPPHLILILLPHLILLNTMNMPMRIPQHTQMSKILRMARITPTMLQIQALQGLIRRIHDIRARAINVVRAAFFGVAGAAFFAAEEGRVGGEAGGEDADVEFDH